MWHTHEKMTKKVTKKRPFFEVGNGVQIMLSKKSLKK